MYLTKLDFRNVGILHLDNLCTANPIKLCFQYKYLDSEQTTVQHVINPSSHSYKILPYNYYISTLTNKTNSVPEITFFLYVQKYTQCLPTILQ